MRVWRAGRWLNSCACDVGFFFFFQAEAAIRVAKGSLGLGDLFKGRHSQGQRLSFFQVFFYSCALAFFGWPLYKFDGCDE